MKANEAKKIAKIKIERDFDHKIKIIIKDIKRRAGGGYFNYRVVYMSSDIKEYFVKLGYTISNDNIWWL